MIELRQLEIMLSSPDEEERLAGVANIARAGVEAGIPLLYLALGDASWRVRKEAIDCFLSFPRASERAEKIIQLLYSDDNPGLRNAAVDILIHLGGETVPALLAEVNCPDPDVRKFILDILGDVKDERAFETMLVALDDEDKNVRNAAVENLGKLRRAQAVPALIGAMNRYDDTWFRFNVLEALAQIGAPLPTSEILPFREDKLLRRALVDCLGRIGHADAVELLVAWLNDPIRNIREASALALRRLSERAYEAVKDALSSSQTNILIALMDSDTLEVVRAAVGLSGLIQDSALAARLVLLVKNEELRDDVTKALLAQGEKLCFLEDSWADADPWTKIYLAYLWGEAGCSALLPKLFVGMSDPNPDLRQTSVQAAGKLNAFSGLPQMLKLLSDPCEEVRDEAAAAIGRLSKQDGTRVVEELLPELTGDDPEVRRLICLILSPIDDRRVDGCLVQGIKDESPAVRRAAAKALSERRTADHLSSLMLALTDEDNEVRRLVVEALGATALPEVLPPLTLALGDENMWVRTAAVRALGRFGAQPLQVQMRNLMGDPVGLVVLTALQIYAEVDPEGAYPFLLQALAHPDEEVVSTALHLLRNIRRRDWLNTFRDRLLNHRHWDVRLNFVRFLAENEGELCRPCLKEHLQVESEELIKDEIHALLRGMQD